MQLGLLHGWPVTQALQSQRWSQGDYTVGKSQQSLREAEQIVQHKLKAVDA